MVSNLWEFGEVTPAMYSVAVDTFRPWAGSLSICSRSNDRADDRVFGLQHRAGRHDVDPFLDAPTSILKSTRAVCAADSVTFDGRL